MSTLNPYQHNIIEKAAMFRGTIITSYAQIEHMLVDIYLKCKSLPEYAALKDRFPFRLESRIKFIREMTSMPGVLLPYKDNFELIIQNLLLFEEIRHFLAHGLMHVKTQKDHWHEITYRMYRVTGKDQSGKDIIEEGLLTTNLSQLENTALMIAKYSTEAVSLFRDIYLKHEIRL